MRFSNSEGRLREREWASIERMLTPWRRSALFEAYWNNRSFMYSDQFVVYVNELEGTESFRPIGAKANKEHPLTLAQPDAQQKES